MLDFEEHGHVYRWDGMVIPSVTQILRDWSPTAHIDPALLAVARQRGEEVHWATALDDHCDLDPDSISDEIRPYLEAWRLFRAEHHFEPRLIEHRVYCGKYGYAGQIDRIGSDRRSQVLLDVKSGGPDPTHGPQTAAYMEAAHLPLTSVRACVYLFSDGQYRYERHTSSRDMSVFLAALTYYNWKRANGI